MTRLNNRHFYVPAENTKNQVHHKESSDDDHRDEVDPLPGIAHGIFYLKEKWKRRRIKRTAIDDTGIS